MLKNLDNFLVQFMLYRYLVGGTFIKLTDKWDKVCKTHVLEDKSRLFILESGFSVHQDFVVGIEIYGVSY
jgi:hypothetical protein